MSLLNYFRALSAGTNGTKNQKQTKDGTGTEFKIALDLHSAKKVIGNLGQAITILSLSGTEYEVSDGKENALRAIKEAREILMNSQLKENE